MHTFTGQHHTERGRWGFVCSAQHTIAPGECRETPNMHIHITHALSHTQHTHPPHSSHCAPPRVVPNSMDTSIWMYMYQSSMETATQVSLNLLCCFRSGVEMVAVVDFLSMRPSDSDHIYTASNGLCRPSHTYHNHIYYV